MPWKQTEKTTTRQVSQCAPIIQALWEAEEGSWKSEPSMDNLEPAFQKELRMQLSVKAPSSSPSYPHSYLHKKGGYGTVRRYDYSSTPV